MTKGRVAVSVDVTPMLQQGNEIFCEIDPSQGTPGKFVKGGVIKLPAGGQFDLTYNLKAGDIPGLQFDAADPFCSDASTCPAPGAQNGQYANPRVTAPTTLSVEAAPVPPRNAVHYRLNFSNGTYCDPIIINGIGNLGGGNE